jgi:serine protease AprX
MVGTCSITTPLTRRVRPSVGTVLLAGALFVTTPSAATAPIREIVVRAEAGSLSAVAQTVRSLGGTIEHELTALDELTARVPDTHIDVLRREAGVTSVTVNQRLHMTADGYDPGTDTGSMVNTARAIGARRFTDNGYNGAGVDVAIIDSGIAPVAGLNAPGKIINGPDLSFESQVDSLRYIDTYGHGTHLAGIIAGRDPDPTNPDYFAGIAPGARLVSLKVADAYGNTDVSQVLAAIDWVVQHRADNGLNIRVLNLSFGTDANQDPTVDPLCHAVEVAWQNGIVVVTAAGNSGTSLGHLANPAIDKWVIAVGAEDPHASNGVNDDTVTDFSSRGDGVRNPTFVTPGKSIISLRDPGSAIDQNHPEGRVGSRYFRGSGTSQSAAVASGAAALILSQRPQYTPDEVKSVMKRTARSLPNGGSAVAQGAGVLALSDAFSTDTTGARQSLPRSNGRGSLEGSRGSLHLMQNDAELSGEQDIFGVSYDSTSAATLSESGSSWSGGDWNGSSWSGSSWSGSSWSGSSWSGSSWSGSSWSSGAWTSNIWTGSSWTGSGWQGSSWSITHGLMSDGWSTSEWG